MADQELNQGFHTVSPQGIFHNLKKDLIDTFFEMIIREAAAVREVKISGSDNFLVRSKAERPGRNPRTGEVVVVAARRTASFQATTKLKSSIQSAL